jgi:hypothetical protein
LLGPPHSNDADIAKLGVGRHSDWRSRVYVFSAIDNSDPKANRKFNWAVVPDGYPFSDFSICL